MTILLLILSILLAPAQQTTPACAVATSDIAASLVGVTCLELPAGVYDVPSTITTTASIHGAGAGRTVLRTTGAAYALRLVGQRQTIADLSIRGDTPATSGLVVASEALSATIERVEVTGAFAAAGIETYKQASAPAQYVTIRDSFVHDIPGNGLLIDSSRNRIEHNTIARVGSGSLYHGMYIQGGDNLIAGNTIEGARGYSLHGWHYVPNMDGSGNIYRDNLSIAPGAGHIVVGGNTRHALITGNTFRGTGLGIDARAPVSVLGNTFEDVVIEGGAIIGIGPSAPGSIVSGNRILAPHPTPPYGARFGVRLDAPALVSGNAIDMASVATGIHIQAARVQVQGNRVTASTGTAWQVGVKVVGADTIVSGNIVDLPFGAAMSGAATAGNLCWIGGTSRAC